MWAYLVSQHDFRPNPEPVLICICNQSTHSLPLIVLLWVRHPAKIYVADPLLPASIGDPFSYLADISRAGHLFGGPPVW